MHNQGGSDPNEGFILYDEASLEDINGMISTDLGAELEEAPVCEQEFIEEGAVPIFLRVPSYSDQSEIIAFMIHTEEGVPFWETTCKHELTIEGEAPELLGYEINLEVSEEGQTIFMTWDMGDPEGPGDPEIDPLEGLYLYSSGEASQTFISGETSEEFTSAPVCSDILEYTGGVVAIESSELEPGTYQYKVYLEITTGAAVCYLSGEFNLGETTEVSHINKNLTVETHEADQIILSVTDIEAEPGAYARWYLLEEDGVETMHFAPTEDLLIEEEYTEGAITRIHAARVEWTGEVYSITFAVEIEGEVYVLYVNEYLVEGGETIAIITNEGTYTLSSFSFNTDTGYLEVNKVL